MVEWKASVQVGESVLNSVVFLGQPGEHGFSADGTAFLVSITDDTTSFTYLVSCRHVVRPFSDDRAGTPSQDSIWIRVNRKDKPPKTYETRRCDWTCHPDRFIDVCVYLCDIRKWKEQDDADVNILDIEIDFFTPQKAVDNGPLWIGDHVFIAGVFVGRVGERRNIPVLRLGSIAALAHEPVQYGSPRRPAFLIETKSMGGTSGSPVFIHTAPVGRFIPTPGEEWSDLWVDLDTGKVERPYYLIGMLSHIHSGNYAADFADLDDERIVPKDADFNAGIAVVLPYAQILEVIDQPQLKESRMAAIEHARKATGIRPASSGAAAPTSASAGAVSESTSANPSHREDFMRLADAASRKKPQGE